MQRCSKIEVKVNARYLETKQRNSVKLVPSKFGLFQCIAHIILNPLASECNKTEAQIQ